LALEGASAYIIMTSAIIPADGDVLRPIVIAARLLISRFTLEKEIRELHCGQSCGEGAAYCVALSRAERIVVAAKAVILAIY
jgi:hypothetical protein